ncbi:LLM class flavin-dependent oxidoreductase [Klugiella xanthotipulae]|uniref:Alkanesulfonate monooxygenase SsuD/methylene tetrahydromethanopterin reductase-like flavin-dependent oxidoreductase (Luciferase family) n=1 Tax=Klugiella xanthotipulae TaxID=244735 RepID=A0A543I5J1_9MICO|nr:LLM class flavin-dependent oxidoreductase [Klugiella xanthotipulae]TQM65857.1 alkanesulfonate monooxygenase SsuD/methylene tetrahydromethanopterin reductase-like flavin-dependent oxidoreductase (luciferase family) [Klugiella xanthotipulae]
MTSRTLQLGFLTFVPNDGGPEGAGQSLHDGIRLFELAEELGYHSGWVRVRHFEPFLASPMTFLAAVSQRTERIRLGTGVIPARYEDPIRLAEDASTVDLLSGGRVELGLSAGIGQLAPILDPVFGVSERPFSAEAQHRIERLRAALAGETIAHSGTGFMSVPADTNLTLSPRSPGLADRVWYGPGSVASARRTGEQGLDLHVSTLNTEETGDPFDVRQAEQIRAYREAFAHSPFGERRSGRVAVGRIVIPVLNEADAEAHNGFITAYNARMHPDGRPHDRTLPMRFSPLHTGTPEQIIESLRADAALPEIDSLIITLPAPGGAEAHQRILRVIAEDIAPHLGWTPHR